MTIRDEKITSTVPQSTLAGQHMNKTVSIEVPKDSAQFRMPPALHVRLHDLLDQQDRTGKLTAKERREAEALVALVDTLSLLKARVEAASRRQGP